MRRWGERLFSPTESEAVSRLEAAYSNLVLLEGGRLDSLSPEGHRALTSLLSEVEAASNVLCLPPACRSYRKSFAANYGGLFAEGTRGYRVDLFTASIDCQPVILVNGEAYFFSPLALRLAEALQQSWAEFGAQLSAWANLTRHSPASRAELQSRLRAFDDAWAQFEQTYISELIRIEDLAKGPVAKATESAWRLHLLVLTSGGGSGGGKSNIHRQTIYEKELRVLVALISKLNVAANFKRGVVREDLTADIFLNAKEALAQCDYANQCGESQDGLRAKHILAAGVVESFNRLYEYLQRMAGQLEFVDPQLDYNPDMMSLLANWEQSWQLAAKYLQDQEMAQSICTLVAELRRAQRLAPQLSTMAEEVNAELCLMIPRLVWLIFLAKPDCIAHVMKTLLPHRFNESQVSLECNSSCFDEELQAFAEHYKDATEFLGELGVDSAWEVLVKSVVYSSAANALDGTFSPVVPHLMSEAEDAVKKLLHELEGWSMEVQRCAPTDWNQFLGMLVDCM